MQPSKLKEEKGICVICKMSNLLMCCLVHIKVSKKKASKISVGILFPYLLKLS